MRVLGAIGGLVLILVVLVDIFHTIVIARRSRRSFRVTRAFYKLTWRPFAWVALRIRSGGMREDFLGTYGPLSLLVLYALWAVCLATGFALLQWGTHAAAKSVDMYQSAAALVTLESGNPREPLAKLFVVTEAAVGFAMLGLVIGYLPVLYQAFSQRELHVSILDARAGSPPSAGGLLRVRVADPSRIERYLENSEQWAAETVQNQLCFPMLVWFRSLHSNQSWLTTLTALTDWAAVISVCSEGDVRLQAEFTFAMMRHVLVDLVNIFKLKPDLRDGRLTSDAFKAVLEAVAAGPACLKADRLHESELRKLTEMYEPQARALSDYLLMTLPAWNNPAESQENWKTNHTPDEKQHFAISDPFRDN